MTAAKRLTAKGLVHNGRCNLFAITINKSDTADTIVSLKDSLDASGDILWEFWETNPICFAKNFEPQLLFENGIYLDITGKVYSVIIECL